MDAFPFRSGGGLLAADHFRGPLSLFPDAGFSVISKTKRLAIVRKQLGGRA